jgi:hypothetical protein
MMKIQSLKISILATQLVMVCGLLAAGAPAIAESNDGPCSNRTLSGDYGFSLKGVLFPAPGLSLAFRGVVMVHYDGKGNFTQLDHVVTNGVPPAQEWRPGSGTYTVNPNCTGISVIHIPGNPQPVVTVHFVVVKQGQEIFQVVDGNAVTSVGIKVE